MELVDGQIDCKAIVGYASVYRIQFSLACFFFLMMIVMLCVKKSKDPRSGFQNGSVSLPSHPHPRLTFVLIVRFWFFKLLIIIGICVGAFFIPNQGFAPSKTSSTVARRKKQKFWTESLSFLLRLALMVIGSICGFVFILIQLILLIDFAHRFVRFEGETAETIDFRFTFQLERKLGRERRRWE